MENDGQGGASVTSAATGTLSSAEQAVQERAADRCWVQPTGGA